MERRVTVNDQIEELSLEIPPEAHWQPDAPAETHGPCLYLGPGGERCARAALPGGYCARHHTDDDLRLPLRPYGRVLIATIALILVIWPYLSDLLHELVRWLTPSQ